MLRQVARHGAQIQGHDHINSKIAFVSNSPIQRPFPELPISQGSFTRQETHRQFEQGNLSMNSFMNWWLALMA